MSGGCWVPVPLRWRHVLVGDTFVGKGDRLWHVTGIGPDGALLRVDAVHGFTPFAVHLDPDEVVAVLMPATERDAVELTRDQLGARLIARRSD